MGNYCRLEEKFESSISSLRVKLSNEMWTPNRGIPFIISTDEITTYQFNSMKIMSHDTIILNGFLH